MKTIYSGKTKDVLRDGEKVYLLFKDSATGEDGNFDPGSNTVGGSVEGKGKVGLAISSYYFELLNAHGILTHYLGSDIEKGLMEVRELQVPPLEFVLRYYTAGSMCRRFNLEEGIAFEPPYAEVTLKDDDMGDPLISERICIMKGYLKPGQYEMALDLVGRVGEILRGSLASMGYKLLDFKIEVGFDKEGNVYVADEITPDIWRMKDETGAIPNQIDASAMILSKIKQ